MNQATNSLPTTLPAAASTRPASAAPTDTPTPAPASPRPASAPRGRYWEHIDPTSRSLYPVD